MITKLCWDCKLKRYSDSLFFGHIVLEKIIKANYVAVNSIEAPKMHDLVKLAQKSSLNLLPEDMTYLKVVNRFNMRTRYPDIKLYFYKKCDYDYTNKNLEKIKKLYKILCQKLKQKKL